MTDDNKQLPTVAKRLPPAAGRGRQKGELNKTTVALKEALLMSFDEIGGVEALTTWGKANPTEFYKLWAKLIPRDVNVDASVNGALFGMLMSLPDA